jgi:hypothetical protein
MFEKDNRRQYSTVIFRIYCTELWWWIWHKSWWWICNKFETILLNLVSSIVFLKHWVQVGTCSILRTLFHEVISWQDYSFSEFFFSKYSLYELAFDCQVIKPGFIWSLPVAGGRWLSPQTSWTVWERPPRFLPYRCRLNASDKDRYDWNRNCLF